MTRHALSQSESRPRRTSFQGTCSYTVDLYRVRMSADSSQEQGRPPPPKLLAWTVTALASLVAWQCYAPQYDLLEWGPQSKLDELCGRTKGCVSAVVRTKAAADRRSLISVVTLTTAHRWKPAELEHFEREYFVANDRREVELVVAEVRSGEDGRSTGKSGGAR